MTKLGIGTVEFGMTYGVGNTEPQASPLKITEILQFARENNILTVDTSPLYGSSETVLGQDPKILDVFRVITKTLKFSEYPITDTDVAKLDKTFRGSLDRLNQEKIYGLLVHQVSDLLAAGGEKLYEKLKNLQEAGLIQKIGVSLYEPWELEEVVSKYALDLIQVPLNALDNRFVIDGHLNYCIRNGIEVHVRSVFLQGLLLIDRNTIPENLEGLSDELKRFSIVAKSYQLSLVEMAIASVKAYDSADVILVGIRSKKELQEIKNAFECPIPPRFDPSHAIASENPLINPRNWNQSR